MTNIQALYYALGEILNDGADKDGYPRATYELLACTMPYIACPYVNQLKCALQYKYSDKANPDAYGSCDECKAHWLFENFEG